ncbi:MAG TPA: helix-turn-helix domain-containing protein [Ilumatobacter sp.]|nr:helix-turn-helix domain-containing protein [Ilumatobacter sp.]
MELATSTATKARTSGLAPTRPLLVSAQEAARLLGIGRTTLYELIKLHLVTPVHIGRCVRFSLVELERYVEGLIDEASRSTMPPDLGAPKDAPTKRTLF